MLTSTTNADCPYFVSEICLRFGVHKSRAALSKVIKVVKILACKHGYSSFVNDLRILYT